MIQKGFLDCFSSEGYDIMESKQDYDIIIVNNKSKVQDRRYTKNVFSVWRKRNCVLKTKG